MTKKENVLHFDAKAISLILLGIFICLLSVFLVASVLVASHGLPVAFVAFVGHGLIHFLTAQAAVDIFMLAAAGGLTFAIATVITVKFVNFTNQYIVQPITEWYRKLGNKKVENKYAKTKQSALGHIQRVNNNNTTTTPSPQGLPTSTSTATSTTSEPEFYFPPLPQRPSTSSSSTEQGRKSVSFDALDLANPEKKKDTKKRAFLSLGKRKKKSEEGVRLLDDETEISTTTSSSYAPINTQIQTISTSSSSTAGHNQFDDENILGNTSTYNGVVQPVPSEEKEKDKSAFGKVRQVFDKAAGSFKKEKDKNKKESKKRKSEVIPSTMQPSVTPSSM